MPRCRLRHFLAPTLIMSITLALAQPVFAGGALKARPYGKDMRVQGQKSPRVEAPRRTAPKPWVAGKTK